jgi:hypothetical protein
MFTELRCRVMAMPLYNQNVAGSKLSNEFRLPGSGLVKFILTLSDEYCDLKLKLIHTDLVPVAYRGEGVGGSNPPSPRNSEVLTKLNRIPNFVENTSVTT